MGDDGVVDFERAVTYSISRSFSFTPIGKTTRRTLKIDSVKTTVNSKAPLPGIWFYACGIVVVRRQCVLGTLRQLLEWPGEGART